MSADKLDLILREVQGVRTESVDRVDRVEERQEEHGAALAQLEPIFKAAAKDADFADFVARHLVKEKKRAERWERISERAGGTVITALLMFAGVTLVSGFLLWLASQLGPLMGVS